MYTAWRSLWFFLMFYFWIVSHISNEFFTHVCSLFSSLSLFIHLLEPISHLLLLLCLFVCGPQRLITATCPSMGKKWVSEARVIYLAVGLKKVSATPPWTVLIAHRPLGWVDPHSSSLIHDELLTGPILCSHELTAVLFLDEMIIPSEFPPSWALVVGGSGLQHMKSRERSSSIWLTGLLTWS